jgi:hypothetical protein
VTPCPPLPLLFSTLFSTGSFDEHADNTRTITSIPLIKRLFYIFDLPLFDLIYFSYNFNLSINPMDF